MSLNDVESENEDEENDQDPPQLSEENNNWPEPDEEVEITESKSPPPLMLYKPHICQNGCKIHTSCFGCCTDSLWFVVV